MQNKRQNEIRNIHGVQVEIAKTAGFCFGVDRAVKVTQKLVEQGEKVTTLGPLIHNPQVIEEFQKQGVTISGQVQDIPQGATAVIRSHGVASSVYEELTQCGVKTEDATCPFVKKIQKIAQEYGENGGTVIIAGNKEHPEVVGIAGHTKGPVFVISNVDELETIFPRIDVEKPIAMVAQTTFQVTKWLECVSFLKKVCTNAAIFDTICSATWERQDEIDEMAHRCDLIIVIGGRESSNTKKLCDVAAVHTRAVQIETAEDLTAEMLQGVQKIGITTGASTPAPVIEEVLNRMSEEILDGEMSFEEMLNNSMKPVHAGQVVKGLVVGVSPSEVTVDIGTKQTGIIKLEELTDDPAVRSAEELVKRDEDIEVVVVKVNDQDGIIYLSKRQLEARKGAEEVAKAAEDGTTMDGYVIESNKGGLVALVKGVKVFIPASQATVRRGDDYTALVRKHVQLKIKEYSSRRTIGSIREVMAAELNAQRDAFWAEVEEGKHYVGTVKSLTSYGAFVDIGGVDGLVHISELSWSRIKHPSEVVNVGDTIEVYVKELDRENHKVSLGFKKKEDDPWEKLRSEYPVGSEFDATVVSVTQFGAFVRILPGIDGLVHISEISHDRVEKVADVLSVGQHVQVQLLDVDFDRKRISLSMKALVPAPEVEAEIEKDGDELVVSSSAEGTVVMTDVEAEMEASAPAEEVVSEEVTE